MNDGGGVGGVAATVYWWLCSWSQMTPKLTPVDTLYWWQCHYCGYECYCSSHSYCGIAGAVAAAGALCGDYLNGEEDEA